MKPVVVSEPLPTTALLCRYTARKAYTDAYCVDLPGRVSLAELVLAFYTSPLFKLERLILTLLVAKPSLDSQALALSQKATDRFAAWTIEDRTDDQILMRDFLQKTTSWLMCEPVRLGDTDGTRLHFGTAIVPKQVLSTGAAYLGLGFHILIPFHRLYSRALLQAAAHGILHAKRPGV